MPFTHILTYTRRRLYILCWNTDPSAVRFVLALGAVLWGIMLLWPGATFDRPTYTLMARFASEETWGGLFLTQGLFSAYSLIFTEARKRACLLLDGVLGSMLWLGSCVCMLLSVYPPPAAISGEIALAAASWWNLITFSRHNKNG